MIDQHIDNMRIFIGPLESFAQGYGIQVDRAMLEAAKNRSAREADGKMIYRLHIVQMTGFQICN